MEHMEHSEKTLDMIVALCKNRGFVFPGSEIYGGLANSWDYGPLGVEFKNNVKKAWLKKFVQESPYNVGLGRRHFDEPPDLGHHRPCGQLLRPAAGLPRLQGAPPRRQADLGRVPRRQRGRHEL